MNKDPYRYFRVEASEILDALSRGVLELKTLPPASSGREVEKLLRLCHTLKGAAGVVGHEAIGGLAHRLESFVASYQQRADAAERVSIGALVEAVDAIAFELEKLAVRPAEPSGTARASVVDDGSGASVRLELLEMDSVLGSLTELTSRLASARSGVERALMELELSARQLGDALAPGGPGRAPERLDLGFVLDATQRLHDDLRSARVKHVEALEGAERRACQALDDVRRLRLLPALPLLTELGRAARAAAMKVGVRVELEASGDDLRLDAHVLRELRAALLQLVRNAVAHAFEPEPERRQAGKPAIGRIVVRFALRGARVVVTFSDDGRGIDESALRSALVAGGLVSEDDANGMDVGELVRTAMRIGASTRASATELAGRGVGLQVVGSVIARLRGSILTRSTPGRGTEFELEVPVSMTGVPALVVAVSGEVATIPLDAVERTRLVASTDVTYAPDGDALVDDGEVVRFATLSRILGLTGEADGERRDKWIAVLLESVNGARVAVGVDAVSGIASEVVMPLPRPTVADSLVVGASLDERGEPRIALDPQLLVERVLRLAGATVGPVEPVKRSILVVDDSLTSRMLERSILEAAGYDVTTAASAEEALDRAHERSFALFVVDVEMPGMSGFEFVARTREDPTLASVPAVLVTSRAAPEDRRRGLEVGARGYIVKGEFAQDEFLDAVRRFVL